MQTHLRIKLNNWIFLLLCLGIAASAAPFTVAHAATIESFRWREYSAYRLSDGKTEAVVVPALSGRVMSFNAVGGRNWLWNAPPESTQGDGYKNWGGDKTFAGPHPSWGIFAPSLWPPQPSWDGPAHTARVLSNGHLQTVGNLWTGFGIRVVREFSFAENGEFVVSQTLEKVQGEPRLISIWQVAQINPPDAVYVPLSPKSAYKNNFHAFRALPQDASVQVLSPSLLHIKPTSGRGYKIGADSPVAAIAAVKDDVALVLRAAKPKGEYPDGAEGAGFPVEFYNHGEAGAGQYNELELLSPTRHFVIGAAWTHTVRWSLHPIPADEAQAQSAVEQLLASAPYYKEYSALGPLRFCG